MSGPSDEQLRERTREQILASLGGWSGTVITAIPPVVFVIVNALAHLRTAIIAAIGVRGAAGRLPAGPPAAGAAGDDRPVQRADRGADRRPDRSGPRLLPARHLAGSICYGTVFAISLLVRRPLIGVVWEFLDPAPLPEGTRWYRVKPLRRAYDLASLAALAMFAARALVQLSLFRDNKTGWLAVTRIVMGFPLYLLVVAAVVWLVRRGRQQLPPLEPAPTPAAEPAVDARGRARPADAELSGGADRAPDRGLGLGQRDE